MAKKTAKGAARAEIARLFGDSALEKCPSYQDPQALLEHGIATMVRISQSEDSRVALQASVWLIRYAQTLMRAPSPAEDGNAQVIAELRALYAKRCRTKRCCFRTGPDNNGRGMAQDGLYVKFSTPFEKYPPEVEGAAKGTFGLDPNVERYSIFGRKYDSHYVPSDQYISRR